MLLACIQFKESYLTKEKDDQVVKKRVSLLKVNRSIFVGSNFLRKDNMVKIIITKV